MSPYDILVKARALIADAANWTQNAFARDTAGNIVSAIDPTACCRCAEGAICAVVDLPTHGDATPNFEGAAANAVLLLRDAGDLLIGRSERDKRDIGTFAHVAINDADVTIPGLSAHEAILAVYDTAIERAAKPEV